MLQSFVKNMMELNTHMSDSPNSNDETLKSDVTSNVIRLANSITVHTVISWNTK